MNHRRRTLAGLTMLAVMLLLAAATGTALAAPPSNDDFYRAPVPLPSHRNGDLIKSEAAGLFGGTPIAALAAPATATRIMYQSADTFGVPIATTGIVLNPTIPWTGPGRRPLVSYAVGTHGAGDACAPSRLLTEGITFDGSGMPFVESQILDIHGLLARGMAVVVTDYQGLGTSAGHTYLQPLPEAHAVLDAARAALRLGVVPPDAPIGIWGYSQGGGAAGGAAEQAHSYAPELNLKGTVVGAPPVNVASTLRNVDGKALSGVIGFFLNGLFVSHPEFTPRITAMLNPAGIDFLHATAQQCDASLALWASCSTRDFTTNGQSIIDRLEADPDIRSVLDGYVLGGSTPANPVLIVQNTNDDVVVPAQTRELAATWCSHGATVDYPSVIDTPPLLPQAGLVGHAWGILGTNVAVQWLADRFDGIAAPSTCA
ncbi:lipase family protein [Rhodococcus opacus]|uniref:lipase family protein n=1 Tax=Rhodococcus opacus TaxID=37919 RepID=UPI002473F43C|nr:lipase family protein [Rhodococcus opacus]MDH6291975.1 hypothetical protein [Rhodococcus opacus]